MPNLNPKANILTGLLAASILALVCFPLYIVFYLDPAFVDIAAHNSERQAIKVANFMAMRLFPSAQDFQDAPLSPVKEGQLLEMRRVFKIVKVRVFTPTGKIIYSSDKPEIGDTNRMAYFKDIVARGQTFSKLVRKDTTSMEGQLMPVDVVETYVPIVYGPDFAGAFEIYYDNTTARTELHRLLSRVMLSVGAMALVLLSAMLVSFLSVARSLRERDQAVLALRQAHGELEERVLARTEDLTRANQALSQEVSFRQETENDKEQLIEELTQALARVKTLSGLLPICANCQQIRDPEGKWRRVEDYISTRTDAEFTHGICPQCAKELYPDLYGQLEGQPRK